MKKFKGEIEDIKINNRGNETFTGQAGQDYGQSN